MPPKRRVQGAKTSVTTTASGTQGDKIGKVGPSIRPHGITAPSTKDLPLPGEIEKAIIEKRQKEKSKLRKRDFAVKAQSKAAEAAPAQPTLDQQEAAEAVVGTAVAIVSQNVTSCDPPIEATGPMTFHGGPQMDISKGSPYYKVQVEMLPEQKRRLGQYLETEKQRYAEIMNATPKNEVSFMSQKAIDITRELYIGGIIKRMVQFTTMMSVGTIGYITGATEGLTTVIDNAISEMIVTGGYLPETVLDGLALLQHYNIHKIAIGGILQSETAFLAMGTLNGLAITRYLMHMNDELREDLREGEEPIHIIEILANDNLTLEQQLEAMHEFVIQCAASFHREVRRAVDINPYKFVLQQINKENVEIARDRVKEIIRDLITEVATRTQAEAAAAAGMERQRMREAPQSQLINPADGSITLPQGHAGAFDMARNLYEIGLSAVVSAGTDIFNAAVLASVPRKEGKLYGIYELLAKGVFTGYEYLCPSAVKRAQREQLDKLIADELVPTYQLTDEQILMIEELAYSAAGISGIPIKELVNYRESFLAEPAQLEDSQRAVFLSFAESQEQASAEASAAAPAPPSTGGARKRKHHSTRSSTSSKSSKSGTRKHGKSKRVKKGGAKTRHMRLAPGAGRRTRKHSKRGRK